MGNWSQQVKTTAVWEGPPGTLGHDKTPEFMARVICQVNPKKGKGRILRYMQFFINRAGRNLSEDHKIRIKKAMQLIRESNHPQRDIED